MLSPCPSCRRHVKSSACPFCGASRALYVGAVVLSAAAAACRNDVALYGGPPPGPPRPTATEVDAGTFDVPAAGSALPAAGSALPALEEDAAGIKPIRRPPAPMYGAPPARER